MADLPEPFLPAIMNFPLFNAPMISKKSSKTSEICIEEFPVSPSASGQPMTNELNISLFRDNFLNILIYQSFCDNLSCARINDSVFL